MQATTNFTARIRKMTAGSARLETRIGTISSLVARNTAIKVPAEMTPVV